MQEYSTYLKKSGLSENTQIKYLRDAKALLQFAGERKITPDLLNEYKAFLLKNHPTTSVKSMAIAANKCLEFIDCPHRIAHKDVVCTAVRFAEKQLTSEEYKRIPDAAKIFPDDRMYMLIKTLCSADPRVSELKYVTVNGVYGEEIKIPSAKHFREVFCRKSSARS